MSSVRNIISKKIALINNNVILYNTVALLLVYLTIKKHQKIDLVDLRVLKVYIDDFYDFNPIK